MFDYHTKKWQWEAFFRQCKMQLLPSGQHFNEIAEAMHASTQECTVRTPLTHRESLQKLSAKYILIIYRLFSCSVYSYFSHRIFYTQHVYKCHEHYIISQIDKTQMILHHINRDWLSKMKKVCPSRERNRDYYLVMINVRLG